MTNNPRPVTGPRLTFPAPRNFEDHFVTGTPAELAAVWANHHQAGTLITWLKPRLLTDGRYQMMIRLRTGPHRPAQQFTAPTAPAPAVTSPASTQRPRRIPGIAVAIATVTGVIAGLVAVAAYLLGQLVELITNHAGLIIAGLALAAILTAAAARRSSSGRRHCPGC